MTLNLERTIGTLNPDFQRFPSRRSVVHSTKGIISSTQPLANEAGYKVLAQGGNAVDAAVAVAAALNLTEPMSTGIGGDVFCLFYDASTMQVRGINGSGRAPKNLTIDKLKQCGIKGSHIPFQSVHAATIPGAASGWIDSVEAFGSGKVSMEQILQPVIQMCRDGVPISSMSSYLWQNAATWLPNASPNWSEILYDDKSAPQPGQLFHNPQLADTFEMLAKEGKKGFYEGRIAEAIVKVCRDLGGEITLEDLKEHRGEMINPIKVEYNGFNLWECPPNGQGIVALLALGIVREVEKGGKYFKKLKDLKHNSTKYLHLLIDALRLGFSDGMYYVADQQKANVPVQGLLSEEYLRTRSQLIDLTAPKVKPVRHGSPPQSSDTVYLSVTDQWGNACSFINSNYAGFGTGVVPKGCGFPLQCRGAGFDLVAGRPNSLEGGKRPYHTIIPAMVTDAHTNELFACYGVMGGYMQPQGDCPS